MDIVIIHLNCILPFITEEYKFLNPYIYIYLFRSQLPEEGYKK
jgi:hypothetical protein